MTFTNPYIKMGSNAAFPIDDAHRYQQQSLTRLFLNHYHTAAHDLSPHPRRQGTGLLQSRTEQQRWNCDAVLLRWRPHWVELRRDLQRL